MWPAFATTSSSDSGERRVQCAPGVPARLDVELAVDDVHRNANLRERMLLQRRGFPGCREEVRAPVTRQHALPERMDCRVARDQLRKRMTGPELAECLEPVAARCFAEQLHRQVGLVEQGGAPSSSRAPQPRGVANRELEHHAGAL